MAVHFTYSTERPEGDLKQGDLLQITDALRAILHDYHPHYARNPDYRFLMVITQSCDLAFRDGRCASRYISLAAVRPVDTLIRQEIERQSTSSIEKHLKTFPEHKRSRMEDFVAKLLNNNLPEYFYLEPEPAFDIDGSYVSYLALSIAIRSEHYAVCKEARFAGLREIFGAKLGWLVGNMYSRVATPDWVTERFESVEDFQNKVSEIVEGSAGWVPRVVFDRLVEAQKERRKEERDPSYYLTQEEIERIADEYMTEQRMKQENVARFVVEEARKVMKKVDRAELKELESSLLNNRRLQELIV